MTVYLQQVVLITTPLVLVAMGGLFSERSGVFAIGLEGFMLIGSFASIAVGAATHSWSLAVLGAATVGCVVACIFAVATVTFGAEQIVSGIAVNIAVLGLTGFLLQAMYGLSGAPMVEVGRNIPLPALSSLPGIGPVLFDQGALTYLAYILVPLIAWIFARTRIGLIVTATGEHAAAVATSGISVTRVRYLAVVTSGALAGIGGAALALQQTDTFAANLTNGRGYIALAGLILGRWNPVGAALSVLLFGAADALQTQIQVISIPVSSYIVQMLPYLAAIVAIAGIGRGARHPSNAGMKYEAEQRV